MQLIVMYKVARMFMQKTICKRGKATRVPRDLNAMLSKLGLLELFTQPPAWAPG